MKIVTGLLLPERLRKEPWLTASLVAEGIGCRRRLWLSEQGIYVWEQRVFEHPSLQLKMLYLADKEQEPAPWWEGWQFEVPLPTGDRLDAWFPDEAVAIEYKTGRPHVTHIYQVWSLYRAMRVFAITGVQIQLWYPVQWKDATAQLSHSFGYDWMPLLEDQVVAVRIEPPDPSEYDQMERIISVLASELMELESPPKPFAAGHPACQECHYYDYCHIGHAEREEQAVPTIKETDQ